MYQIETKALIELKEKDIERFADYLREKECAQATIRKYLTDVRTFYRYLGKERQVSKEKVVKYRQALTEDYQYSSVNSMLAALNQFFSAMDLQHLKVKRLRIQNQMFQKEEKSLSKQEYLKLLQTARKEKKEELALLMETICSTGIRISELQFITVQSIKRGSVKVWNKGKCRIVMIPRETKKRLARYVKAKQYKSGPIFRTKSGKPKDRSNIWREMKTLAKGAQIHEEKIFPHNLRHLFARTFYEKTKNIVHLADILGHSSVEVTRIYTCGKLEEWRRNIERLDLLGKKITT
ncbi:MAG: tyrosine-type recombinase/integrase [Ruminococcus sp.]